MWMRIVLVVVALSAPAHANPAAEKVFQDGKAFLAAGKIDEACDAFRRSQELEARVGTLLNLGECEEKRGKIASAWVAFVDARALATRQSDQRASYADQRATALAPKLSYLTMKIVAARRPPGFVVRRNGWDVPSAEFDLEVPLDPGHYELDAVAPGFFGWKHAFDLAVGQRAAVAVPDLEVDPSSPVPEIVAAPVVPVITSRRLGVGAAIGLSSDTDFLLGVRVPFHLAVVGPGTIRAVPSVFYSHIVDGDDIYQTYEVFSAGFALEYVIPVVPQFVVAAGLGIGYEFFTDSYNSGTVFKRGSGSVRVSPTLRLAHSIDLAVHVQGVYVDGSFLGLGSLGVDYFFR